MNSFFLFLSELIVNRILFKKNCVCIIIIIIIIVIIIITIIIVIITTNYCIVLFVLSMLILVIVGFTYPPTVHFKFITKCGKCFYKLQQLVR